MASPDGSVDGMAKREEESVMEAYLTTQEVAARFRTPIETVRYWRQQGQGPASFKVGRRVLYRREDVERWANERYAATSRGGDAA